MDYLFASLYPLLTGSLSGLLLPMLDALLFALVKASEVLMPSVKVEVDFFNCRFCLSFLRWWRQNALFWSRFRKHYVQ